MNQASAEIQWGCLRRNHSFLVKRDGIFLSREPGNLMNKHSFRSSGLANHKRVTIGADKDGKIAMTTRK